jgi:hypothetical protein
MSGLLDIFLLAAEFLLYPVRRYHRRRHLLRTLPAEITALAHQARRTAVDQDRQPFNVLVASLEEQPHLRERMIDFAIVHIFAAYTTFFRSVDLGTRYSVLGRHATAVLKQAGGDQAEARRTMMRRLSTDPDLGDLLLRWAVKRVLTTLPPA